MNNRDWKIALWFLGVLVSLFVFLVILDDWNKKKCLKPANKKSKKYCSATLFCPFSTDKEEELKDHERSHF